MHLIHFFITFRNIYAFKYIKYLIYIAIYYSYVLEKKLLKIKFEICVYLFSFKKLVHAVWTIIDYVNFHMILKTEKWNKNKQNLNNCRLI